MERAYQAVALLRDRDMEGLAGLVHPEMGLRLSPMAYVTDYHQIFYASELPMLMEDDTKFYWGPSDLWPNAPDGPPWTFSDFLDFLYTWDYASATYVAVNQRIAGAGHTINNIDEYFPGSIWVEFHHPGTVDGYWMNWGSLRMVFLSYEGQWYLVGLINDHQGV